MQGVPFHQTCIRKEPRLPDSLLSCSHSLATQALQSTVCQPHLPVPVTVTGLCWFSTSSGLNKLGVSRTLSQPGEVKGLQQATLTPRAGNQPDGAMVTPTKHGGGTTGDSLFMCPYSCRGYFPPFPGACAGGGHIFWKPLPTEMQSGSNVQVSASGGGSAQQNTFPVGLTRWKVRV